MADADGAVDPEPDHATAIQFRFRSAFCRIGVAFGEDTTVGAPDDGQVDDLLRSALAREDRRLVVLEVTPIPRFPVECVRFVATVMEQVSERVQTGGRAHETQGGSVSIVVAGGRMPDVAALRLDVANQAPGVRQLRDRFQVRDGACDQLERIDADAMETLQRLP